MSRRRTTMPCGPKGLDISVEQDRWGAALSIIGVSAGDHEPVYRSVSDGGILTSAREEGFSGMGHHNAFPVFSRQTGGRKPQERGGANEAECLSQPIVPY